jgi:hypothetical protein
MDRARVIPGLSELEHRIFKCGSCKLVHVLPETDQVDIDLQT